MAPAEPPANLEGQIWSHTPPSQGSEEAPDNPRVGFHESRRRPHQAESVLRVCVCVCTKTHLFTGMLFEITGFWVWKAKKKVDGGGEGGACGTECPTLEANCPPFFPPRLADHASPPSPDQAGATCFSSSTMRRYLFIVIIIFLFVSRIVGRF